MIYKSIYQSPIGELIIASDDSFLIAILFNDDEKFFNNLNDEIIYEDNKIIKDTKKWLDSYFNKKKPKVNIPIKFYGSLFQKEVWELLCKIPYGKLVSYGDIAKMIAKKRGIKKMAAQAIGGAVGKNPISIIVPCHRVIGNNGALVGYGGGLDKKNYLLNHEGIEFTDRIDFDKYHFEL